jgi:hypothetical protein
MAKPNNRKPHIPCVWGCGKWGKSKREPICVPLIKEEIDLGYKAGIEHYRRAGEMLIEAKEQLPRGEWMSWVKRNFELSHGTAWSYMKLAETSQSFSALKISTLSEVVEPERPSHSKRGACW